MTTRPSLDARFYAVLAAAGPVTYLVHEGAHWIVGRLVGLTVAFSLNGVTPTGAATQGQLLAMWAAGPIVTGVQALLAFMALRRSPNAAALAFLLWAAFMRIVASGISLILPNDEARIGLTLGLGPWTLPALVSVGLAALTWIGMRRFAVRPRDYPFIYLLLSVVTALIVFGDRWANA